MSFDPMPSLTAIVLPRSQRHPRTRREWRRLAVEAARAGQHERAEACLRQAGEGRR